MVSVLERDTEHQKNLVSYLSGGLVDVAIRRRVNILCIQETKWKGQKAKEVEDTGFKLWYTGATPGRNGVGILKIGALRMES